MARSIVLSNGELHVGLNEFGMVHDFYYPYVGFENHSAGADLRHKIGIYVDGKISWLDDAEQWKFTFSYPYPALVGHIIAKNESIGILLEFDDFIDSEVNAFMRYIQVVNLRNNSREVRLFMHQAFAIGDSRSNTDTAQYLPDSNAILHYRGRRAFVVSGEYKNKPFDQYTVGLFGIEGREGTFRDAEDGDLGGNNVEHGRVDSTIRFKLTLSANSSERVHYWIAAGTNIRKAIYIHKKIQDDSAMYNLKRTSDWWDKWLEPTYAIINKVMPSHRKTFLQSMMIIKSQIDKRGAIIASTDTSMLNYSRDAYAYSWPRDGAYVLWPLIRMGHQDEALKFFEFSQIGMHPSGYMMHKYRADGALGSSWHPYLHDGIIAPPIQEDETALTVFIFAQYYSLHPDASLLKKYYKDMIVPMADFMTDFVSKKTGLPKPSYDLWEQVFLTSTHSTAVTYAALLSASDLATASNDDDSAIKWRAAANDIREAAHKYLYNDKRKVFYRGLIEKNNEIIYDAVVDCSSVFGAYIFGLFDSDSEEIISSVETVKEVFGINNGAIGLPRFENDEYRLRSPGILGNYWFITTLWYAQYLIDKGDVKGATVILDWVRDQALSTGIMAEQFDPVTNKNVSPAPLTWAHAEYIATILDLVIKDQ